MTRRGLIIIGIALLAGAAPASGAVHEPRFGDLAAGPVLGGDRVLAVDTAGQLLAAPIAGGPAAPLGARLTGRGERARGIRASATRVIVEISTAGNGMRVVTGPPGGPLTAAPLAACDPQQDFALAGDLAACISRDGSYRPVVVDLTGATPPRTLSETVGGGLVALSLRGPWLLVQTGKLYDTRTGAVVLRFTDATPPAVGEDGTLITASSSEDAMFAPCSGRYIGLGWRTPTSPAAHRLPYRPCSTIGGDLSLNGGRLAFFTQPTPAAPVSVVVGDLNGQARAVATLASSGALIDSDDQHLLVRDSGCGRTDRYFVLDASGAPVGQPLGSMRCPAYLRRRGILRVAPNGVVHGVRVRCPQGCLLNLGLAVHGRELSIIGSGAYPTLTPGGEREVSFRVVRSVRRRLPLRATLEVFVDQRAGRGRRIRRSVRLVRG